MIFETRLPTSEVSVGAPFQTNDDVILEETCWPEAISVGHWWQTARQTEGHQATSKFSRP